MKTSVVIVAAGLGSRMQANINKAFLMLANKPILYHTLMAFERCDVIDEIILVLKAEEVSVVEETILSLGSFDKIKHIVNGGETRAESVQNGLNKLTHEGVVLIHDGARPFVTRAEISNVVGKAGRYGAAVLGVRVKDTIKEVSDKLVIKSTCDRNAMWAVATPQAFKVSTILEAVNHKNEVEGPIWDDAMLVEAMGVKVHMVEGLYENIKITTPIDIIIGESILASRKDA